MIEKNASPYFHSLYEEKTKELDLALPCQDELIACVKEYAAKIRRPDLLGKTVRITNKQLPQLYNIVAELSKEVGVAIPEVYLYEDFYYGVEEKRNWFLLPTTFIS